MRIQGLFENLGQQCTSSHGKGFLVLLPCVHIFTVIKLSFNQNVLHISRYLKYNKMFDKYE